MALRPLPKTLMVPVDPDHQLLVTEAGRDGRNGLTASVLFGKGEETLGIARVSFALPESRSAAAGAWAAVNGCPEDRLHRALLQMAGELEVLVREAEANAKTKPSDDKTSGESVTLVDPEPWPDPVGGADVLDELRDLFTGYLALVPGAAEVMALWVAHTYIFDRFDHTGYLAIVSPQKRSGKTTTLTVIGAVVRRPQPAGNITPSALFRLIQKQQPTLLVDELDRVPADSDLWSVLNTGHTRGTPVIRTTGEDFEPRAFATYGPKMLAYIRQARTRKTAIPDTIEDRCIRVMIQRQAAGERRPKVRSRALDEQTRPICQRLVRWAADESAHLVLPRVPAVLDDRAADSWEPLLAVAEAAGGEWPAKAADLAVRFSAIRGDEETEGDLGALLLADLAELIGEGRLDLRLGLSADEAIHALAGLRDRPWSAFGRSEKPITTSKLARLLKAYGLESKKAGPRTARVWRYPAEAVQDVLLRYVSGSADEVSDPCPPPATRTPGHTLKNAPVSDSGESGVRVSDLKPDTGKPGAVFTRTPDEAPAEPDPADCPTCGSDSCAGDCEEATT